MVTSTAIRISQPLHLPQQTSSYSHLSDYTKSGEFRPFDGVTDEEDGSIVLSFINALQPQGLWRESAS